MTETLPTPLDVRLMNLTATLLFVIGAGLLLAAAGWWAARSPLFAIGRITVHGDLAHNNAVTLRANVMPSIAGNFFSVDLSRVRSAFEAVPWVRRAVVRRRFPNDLDVTLQEQQPAAYWGADDASTLLNDFGEVFIANPDELGDARLPHLAGPADQSADVLAMYHTLAPLFAPLQAQLVRLELSAHGGWRATLASGAVIELGHGTPDLLVARVRRFVQTVTEVTSRYGMTAAALRTADLRYADGYAIRLAGLTTVAPARKKK
ncbi:MAG: Cell division protein FtsQ [Burkholderiaceae bacterium]|jgi:cell division protein FtsQ|nr:MAG: Cell division protein FtsQ [Burkholderiaceae bacterium]